MNKWISITDSLPGIDKEVLICALDKAEGEWVVDIGYLDSKVVGALEWGGYMIYDMGCSINSGDVLYWSEILELPKISKR